MTNRHGLIAGATGTGKTRTLQLIAEQLSAAGVSVFAADVKGDLSGLVDAGRRRRPGGEARRRSSASRSRPRAIPVEYLALGGIGPGVPVRATVSDFGPRLLAKVLDVERDAGAEPRARLPLRRPEGAAAARPLRPARAAHLPRLRRGQGRAARASAGSSSQTVGVLLRALVGPRGRRRQRVLRRAAVRRQRPAAHGTGRPRRHLVPRAAGGAGQAEALLDRADVAARRALRGAARGRRPRQAEARASSSTRRTCSSTARARRSSSRSTQTVRLIRSKGVGVFFITQTPKDIDADVLAQLGNRVQHALRAFTPDDAKALKATVRTFPKSDFYDLEELLQQLGIGEAAVTILSENGVPTPVVHTKLRPPRSRMGPADDVDGGREGVAALREVRRRESTRRARARCSPRGSQQARGSRGRRPSTRARAQEGGEGRGRRRGRDRRLPQLERGQAGPARSRPRSLRDAEEAPLSGRSAL